MSNNAVWMLLLFLLWDLYTKLVLFFRQKSCINITASGYLLWPYPVLGWDLFPTPVWVPSLLHQFFFLFPDVSLQLPWLTANSFITGHKRQVLHLKGRHPPSPPARVKNRPAGIAHRTRCSISTKWRPAGPKRWARNLSSRGTATEAEGTLLPRFFIVLLHSAWLWQKRRREIYPQIQGHMGGKNLQLNQLH